MQHTMPDEPIRPDRQIMPGSVPPNPWDANDREIKQMIKATKIMIALVVGAWVVIIAAVAAAVVIVIRLVT